MAPHQVVQLLNCTYDEGQPADHHGAEHRALDQEVIEPRIKQLLAELLGGSTHPVKGQPDRLFILIPPVLEGALLHEAAPQNGGGSRRVIQKRVEGGRLPAGTDDGRQLVLLRGVHLPVVLHQDLQHAGDVALPELRHEVDNRPLGAVVQREQLVELVLLRLEGRENAPQLFSQHRPGLARPGLGHRTQAGELLLSEPQLLAQWGKVCRELEDLCAENAEAALECGDRVEDVLERHGGVVRAAEGQRHGRHRVGDLLLAQGGNLGVAERRIGLALRQGYVGCPGFSVGEGTSELAGDVGNLIGLNTGDQRRLMDLVTDVLHRDPSRCRPQGCELGFDDAQLDLEFSGLPQDVGTKSQSPIHQATGSSEGRRRHQARTRQLPDAHEVSRWAREVVAPGPVGNPCLETLSPRRPSLPTHASVPHHLGSTLVGLRRQHPLR